MNFEFMIDKKKFVLEVKECKSIFSQMSGLMFRKKSPPLLFVFNRPTKISIHSFFCVPFVAVWINGKNVVDIKIVHPWKHRINPEKEFDKLLEVPSNNLYYKKIVDEHSKHLNTHLHK